MKSKNYQTIAKIIKKNTFDHEGFDSEGYDDFTYIDKRNFLNDLVEAFKQDNPKFDSIRFRKACGVLKL